MFIDDIYSKCSWDGSFENVAVMVAIGANEDGYREVSALPNASRNPPSADGNSYHGSKGAV